ncbi:WG repeat-containing protein [Flammeovirga aprica]|uniref:WG repeat-containing protein n=1 Tax=Flammeovirga aprica JL-4 TaxID=694437 RepID=A0A7X9RZJ7_9BACT|nr:WG repeat-containing protein [Flammeovirga aprica]NME71601.1 WG repeat-containing protein [Flammeovirga aprica JL-4]
MNQTFKVLCFLALCALFSFTTSLPKDPLKRAKYFKHYNSNNVAFQKGKIAKSIPIGTRPEFVLKTDEYYKKRNYHPAHYTASTDDFDTEQEFENALKRVISPIKNIYDSLSSLNETTALEFSSSKSAKELLKSKKKRLEFKGVFEADFIGLNVDGFHIVRRGLKYGMIDEAGRIAIPIEYDNIDVPSEGKVSARKGHKWGYLNLKGETVIPFHFDHAQVFTKGYASVVSNEREGVIDSSGTWIAGLDENDDWLSVVLRPIVYTTTVDIYNYKGEDSEMHTELYIIPNRLTNTSPLVVYNENLNNWRDSIGGESMEYPRTKVRGYYVLFEQFIFDANGRFINFLDQPYKIDSNNSVGEIQIGYVRGQDQVYAIRPQADVRKIDGSTLEISSVTNKLLAVRKRNEGILLFNMDAFEYIHNSKGAIIARENSFIVNGETTKQYDLDGNLLVEVGLTTEFFESYTLYKKGAKYGFIFDDSYTEAVYEAYENDSKLSYIFIKENGKWSVFDKDLIGQTNFEFDKYEVLDEGTFRLYKGNKFQIFDNGKLYPRFFKPIKDEVVSTAENSTEMLYPISTIGKYEPAYWGYLDKKGDVVIPHQFIEASRFKDGLAVVKSNTSKKKGVITTEGKYIIPPVYSKIKRTGKYFLAQRGYSVKLLDRNNTIVKSFEKQMISECGDNSFTLKSYGWQWDKEEIYYDVNNSYEAKIKKAWLTKKGYAQVSLFVDQQVEENQEIMYAHRKKHDTLYDYLLQHNIAFNATGERTIVTETPILKGISGKPLQLESFNKGIYTYKVIDKMLAAKDYLYVRTKEKVALDGNTVIDDIGLQKFICKNEKGKIGVYDKGIKKWFVPLEYDEIVEHQNLLLLRKGKQVSLSNLEGDIFNFEVTSKHLKGMGFYLNQYLFCPSIGDTLFDLKNEKKITLPRKFDQLEPFKVNDHLIVVGDGYYCNFHNERVEIYKEGLAYFYKLSSTDKALIVNSYAANLLSSGSDTRMWWGIVDENCVWIHKPKYDKIINIDHTIYGCTLMSKNYIKAVRLNLDGTTVKVDDYDELSRVSEHYGIE